MKLKSNYLPPIHSTLLFKTLSSVMAKGRIDNEIFINILRIRKNDNRIDLDDIYKEIKKSLGFEDVIKEFIDDRIHKNNKQIESKH